MAVSIVKVHTDVSGNHTITCLSMNKQYPNGQIEIVKEFDSSATVAQIKAGLINLVNIIDQVYTE